MKSGPQVSFKSENLQYSWGFSYNCNILKQWSVLL